MKQKTKILLALFSCIITTGCSMASPPIVEVVNIPGPAQAHVNANVLPSSESVDCNIRWQIKIRDKVNHIDHQTTIDKFRNGSFEVFTDDNWSCISYNDGAYNQNMSHHNQNTTLICRGDDYIQTIPLWCNETNPIYYIQETEKLDIVVQCRCAL
jgi:hypothetical protein